ncbi:MAG: EAL domain-containing protein [Cyanobacteria bacterium P01_C01_bin.89]
MLWETCSDSAVEDIGFDPRKERYLLAESQPGHNADQAKEGESLLEEYFSVLDTGRPILNRELEFHDHGPQSELHGWFIQSVVRVGSTRLLATWRNISARKAAEQNLQRMATTDALTKVGNRYALNEVNLSDFGGGFYVDLDRFKTINDTLGHAIGDALLQDVVTRMQRFLGLDGMVFRLGGDEFLALVRTTGDMEALVARGREMLAEVQRPYCISSHEIRIDASIGVVDNRITDIDELLQAGDIAMYAAKEVGGRVQPWSTELMNCEARRSNIESELRNIRDRHEKEFQLHYQSIVSLKDVTTIVGAEALLRWESGPLGGWVPPGEFIPIAERSGEIYRISDWVLKAAADQVKEWHCAIPISVNVSPWDLEQESFVSRLIAKSKASGIDVSYLSLEITERAIATNLNYYVATLQELSSLQVSLKIDDFGAGESGLRRLLDAPWQAVKIDRSLVPVDGDDAERCLLCTSIVKLAKDLGITTIVEGIETEQQASIVRGMGADAAQGYFFSKPAPARDFIWSA